MRLELENDFVSFLANRTSSTMDLGKFIANRIEAKNHIFAVFAREQLVGRGRDGSQWVQPGFETGVDPSLQNKVTEADFENLQTILNFSEALSTESEFLPVTFVWPAERLKIDTSWLTIAVGCAVLDALNSTASFLRSTFSELPFQRRDDDDKLMLKWPNDIIVKKEDGGFEKICGILCESSTQGGLFGNFSIGIGINFFSAPKIPNSNSYWGWLLNAESLKPSQRKILNKWQKNETAKKLILSRFLTYLQLELTEYLAVFRSVAQLKGLALERFVPLGTVMSVNKGAQFGVLQGLDDSGALLLQGIPAPLHAGDVSVLRFNKVTPQLSAQKLENTTLGAVQKQTQKISAKPVRIPVQRSSLKGFLSAVHPQPHDSPQPLGEGKPVASKKVIMGFDFGNTRAHWGFLSPDSTFAGTFHTDYSLFSDENKKPFHQNLKPLLECLSAEKIREIDVRFVSVKDRSTTKNCTLGLSTYLTKLLPELKIEFTEMSTREILARGDFGNFYAEGQMGPDRALRFLFAKQRAHALHSAVAVFSYGTAVTCEAVDENGQPIESFITSGMQTGLNALTLGTAKLPPVELNAQKALVDDVLWNTEKSLQRGAFLTAAGALFVTMKKHSVKTCYLSGGNAQALVEFIKEELTEIVEDLDFFVAVDLEMKTLLWTEADSVPDETSSVPDHFAGGVKFVTDSLLRSRVANHLKERLPPRREDFRKIGGRLENIGVAERIDNYLSKAFKFHSRETWKDRILAGEVLIHHDSPRNPTTDPVVLSAIKHTYKLKAFDQIWIFHPPEYEPDSLDTFEVIFDDGDLAVFCKPGNLVMHAAGLYVRNTFVSLLEKRGYGDASPVHRIDRETSGMVVCARKVTTRNLISTALMQGKMKKMYLAVCKGTHAVPEHFQVPFSIGDDVDSKIRLKLWVNMPGATDALTYFTKLAEFEGYTLFACLPQTGRTNQIRVHLSAIGQWIVGDKMYHPDENVFLDFYENGTTEWLKERLFFPRHLLHNAGMIGPKDMPNHLGEQAVVCPMTSDMMAFGPLQELMQKAGIPAAHDEQIAYLSDLFSRLLKIDYTQSEVMEAVK